MNIYVESNFVLELALLQEQHGSCEGVLGICEAGVANLLVPAYSLIEPYETLVRRHSQRKEMKRKLDAELRQITRSAAYSQRLARIQDLTLLLIDSADEEAKRLEQVRERFLKTAEVISLEVSVLIAASQYQRDHGLSPQDSVVYASVLSHLVQASPSESCFLNKNSKDFDDPDLVEELKRRRCKMIPRFDQGYEYVREQARKSGDPG